MGIQNSKQNGNNNTRMDNVFSHQLGSIQVYRVFTNKEPNKDMDNSYLEFGIFVEEKSDEETMSLLTIKAEHVQTIHCHPNVGDKLHRGTLTFFIDIPNTEQHCFKNSIRHLVSETIDGECWCAGGAVNYVGQQDVCDYWLHRDNNGLNDKESDERPEVVERFTISMDLEYVTETWNRLILYTNDSTYGRNGNKEPNLEFYDSYQNEFKWNIEKLTLKGKIHLANLFKQEAFTPCVFSPRPNEMFDPCGIFSPRQVHDFTRLRKQYTLD